MSYRNPAAIANHPRVRALEPGVRAAYLITWDRCTDPLGMPRTDLEALLSWASRGDGARIVEELLDAGCLSAIGDRVRPISPALSDDAAVFPRTVDQVTPDTLEAVSLARTGGVLGDLDAEQWAELMDYVGKARTGNGGEQ